MEEDPGHGGDHDGLGDADGVVGLLGGDAAEGDRARQAREVDEEGGGLDLNGK